MRKGFTLIELLAVIVILGIISSIAVASYNSYLESATKMYYEEALKTMKGGAESLITYCETTLLATPSYCIDLPARNQSVTIPLSVLTNNQFIERILDDKTGNLCSGEVVITNRTPSGSINEKLEYKTCLRCDRYTSRDCE